MLHDFVNLEKVGLRNSVLSPSSTFVRSNGCIHVRPKILAKFLAEGGHIKMTHAINYSQKKMEKNQHWFPYGQLRENRFSFTLLDNFLRQTGKTQRNRILLSWHFYSS